MGLSNTMAMPTKESHTSAEEAMLPIRALWGTTFTIQRPIKPPSTSIMPPIREAARPTWKASSASPVCQ